MLTHALLLVNTQLAITSASRLESNLPDNRAFPYNLLIASRAALSPDAIAP